MGGTYEQIGGPGDTPNINPYTGQTWNMLTGANQMAGANFAGNTPDAIMANLIGQAPGLQGLVSQFVGPYADTRFGAAALQAQENARSVGQQYSQQGAVSSGAYESAIARGTALPFAQAQADIAGMGLNLGGQLINQYTGLAGQQMGLQGQLYGQTLGQIGQIGMPSWYEPTYGYKPGFWDYLSPVAAGAAGGAGAVGMKAILA